MSSCDPFMQYLILVFTTAIINLTEDIFWEKYSQLPEHLKSISYCFWLKKKVVFKGAVNPYVLWKVLMWFNQCVLKVPPFIFSVHLCSVGINEKEK